MLTYAKPPKAFESAIDKALPFRDRFSEELIDVLYRSWDDTRERHSAEVAKPHVMMALIKDAQVRAHIAVSGFEAIKLEKQIAVQLSELPRLPVPNGTDKYGASGDGTGTADKSDSGSVGWNVALKDLLSEAASQSDYHGQARLDVWLVYDLLKRDDLFKGCLRWRTEASPMTRVITCG
jgi:hypothetical protein